MATSCVASKESLCYFKRASTKKESLLRFNVMWDATKLRNCSYAVKFNDAFIFKTILSKIKRLFQLSDRVVLPQDSCHHHYKGGKEEKQITLQWIPLKRHQYSEHLLWDCVLSVVVMNQALLDKSNKSSETTSHSDIQLHIVTMNGLNFQALYFYPGRCNVIWSWFTYTPKSLCFCIILNWV